MPKSRIEAFSDGVFAIVITLLVLEIKVPSLAGAPSDAALVVALIDELPIVVSCAASFFIIAIFWVSHHQFWHSLRHADWPLLWLNNLLLLFVVFIPIPTWMIGTYPTLRTPAVTFGVVMACAGLAFLAMRAYAGRQPGLSELTSAETRRAMMRSAVGPIVNLSGAVVALWEPLWFLQPPSGRRPR